MFDTLFSAFDLTAYARQAAFIVAILWTAMFFALGIILDFHWRNYLFPHTWLFAFRMAYFVPGVILLAAMWFSYSAF